MQSMKRFSKKSVWAVLLLVCAIVLTTGGVLAKYVSANRQRTEMESAQFHISSNYLEEADANARYTVADWGSGFDILLYNYEKENIAQISAVDMSYTVRADNGAAVSVKTQDGTTLTPDAQDAYPFATSSVAEYHVLHVTPKADAKKGDTINITVTTSPFEKILTASFDIQNKRVPDYTIKDQGDGTVLVTIRTNDFEDSMTVTWDPSLLSPDNTSDLMQDWTDASATKSFNTERNSTYELLFFKNTEAAYSELTGSGTRITLN